MDSTDEIENPWQRFLSERALVIKWLHQAVLLKDSEIAKAINVDATDVLLIRSDVNLEYDDDDTTQAAPLGKL